MALAVVQNIVVEPQGDNLLATWKVLFYGNDVNPPDETRCALLITDAMTGAQIKAAIRSEIQAAANRSNHTWNGKVKTPEELFAAL